MPWTTPVDRSTGYVVTANDWNQTGQDDLAYLYGDTGWTNITVFSGTWVAGGTQPRYSRTGNMVTLQGQIQSGTINTAAFTLPVGYRPSQSIALATVANNAAAQLTILNTGVCTPVFGATTSFSIACSFSIL